MRTRNSQRYGHRPGNSYGRNDRYERRENRGSRGVYDNGYDHESRYMVSYAGYDEDDYEDDYRHNNMNYNDQYEGRYEEEEFADYDDEPVNSRGRYELQTPHSRAYGIFDEYENGMYEDDDVYNNDERYYGRTSRGRGFASVDRNEVRRIARKGVRASHSNGRGNGHRSGQSPVHSRDQRRSHDGYESHAMKSNPGRRGRTSGYNSGPGRRVRYSHDRY